jgi:hypothetical protein
MPRTDIARLRAILGEDIPSGGEEGDTLFSDREVQEFIDSTPSLDRAGYEGWRVKAARLANLVDTTEGNSQKKYSQLHDNALEMIKMYQRSSGGPTEGRARVGRIKRPAVEW